MAGVVAEFSSAHAMMDYFMRQGRQAVPPGAQVTGLVLQVSSGGLSFHERMDAPTDSAAPSAERLMCMPCGPLLQ